MVNALFRHVTPGASHQGMGEPSPLVNHLTKSIGFVGFVIRMLRIGRNPLKTNRTPTELDAPALRRTGINSTKAGINSASTPPAVTAWPR